MALIKNNFNTLRFGSELVFTGGWVISPVAVFGKWKNDWYPDHYSPLTFNTAFFRTG